MEKALKYFTDDALYFFKANKEEFCKRMQANPDSTDWVSEFYGKDPTVSSKYSFDFEFKDYDPASNVWDIENAIALYELFQEKGLGPATIYNEKFLSGFIFCFGYKYFMRVMGADKESHVFATLFFEDGARRSMARNVVGRLYRYVEMTIDDSLADKYELTKYAFQNPAVFRITYNTNVDGERTNRALVWAFKEWTDETHKSPTIKMVEKVKTHMSILANISETELMDNRELINYLKSYVKSIEHKLA